MAETKKIKGFQVYDIVESDQNSLGIVQSVDTRSVFHSDHTLNADWYSCDGIFICNKNVFCDSCTPIAKLDLDKLDVDAAIKFIIYDSIRKLVDIDV